VLATTIKARSNWLFRQSPSGAAAGSVRTQVNLPTDPEASRERFATSRRQPHENREGRGVPKGRRRFALLATPAQFLAEFSGPLLPQLFALILWAVLGC